MALQELVSKKLQLESKWANQALQQGRVTTDMKWIDIEIKDLKKEKVPYTRCEAVDEGWIWSIPVASRIGSGFIFNRQITDIEDAKDFFVKHSSF